MFRRSQKKKLSAKSTQPSFFSFISSMALLVFFVLAFKDFILDANNIPSGSMVPTLKIGDYLFVNKMRYSLRLPFLGKELIRIDDPQRGDIVTFVPPVEERKHYVKRVMAMPQDRIRIREVPGCELRKARQDSLPASLTGKPSYLCSPSAGGQNEPIVAIIEYRQNDKGPWRRYSLEELPQGQAYQELLDADNAGVLPSEYLEYENYYRPYQPVLYRETVANSKHLIVESAITSNATDLCPEIYSRGCVVPKDHYFVMGDNRDYSKDSRIIGFIHRDNIYGKVIIIYFSINWRDDICANYWRYFREGQLLSNHTDGFPLVDFPPKEQQQYCKKYDFYQQEQLTSASLSLQVIADYIYHTLLYRIPRMSIRWERPGMILK